MIIFWKWFGIRCNFLLIFSCYEKFVIEELGANKMTRVCFFLGPILCGGCQFGASSRLLITLQSQADNVPEHRRASAFGLLSAVGSSAFVCGTLCARFLSISSTFQVLSHYFFLPNFISLTFQHFVFLNR